MFCQLKNANILINCGCAKNTSWSTRLLLLVILMSRPLSWQALKTKSNWYKQRIWTIYRRHSYRTHPLIALCHYSRPVDLLTTADILDLSAYYHCMCGAIAMLLRKGLQDSDKKYWPYALPLLLNAINNSVHTATGYTPNELFLGHFTERSMVPLVPHETESANVTEYHQDFVTSTLSDFFQVQMDKGLFYWPN